MYEPITYQRHKVGSVYKMCPGPHFLEFPTLFYLFLFRGVLPLTERKQAIIQNTERIRLYKYHNSNHTQQDLVEGTEVCLRTAPIFGVGAKAIHVKGAQVQVNSSMHFLSSLAGSVLLGQ